MPTHPIATSLIPVSQVHPNPDQPRKTFSPEDQEALKLSIQERGLINPISVIQRGEGNYLIIAGERRFRAASELGWQEIDARIWPPSTPPAEVEMLSLVENLQRKDLNPLEIAQGYELLTKDPHNLTQEEIAKQVGKDQPTVARFIAFLAEPPEIQEIMSRDIISPKHLRFLDRLTDLKQRIDIAKKVEQEGWTTRETEDRISRLLGKEVPSANTKASAAPPLSQVKSPFTAKGTKVDIVTTYDRMEDLDQFLTTLRGDLVAWSDLHPIERHDQPLKAAPASPARNSAPAIPVEGPEAADSAPPVPAVPEPASPVLPVSASFSSPEEVKEGLDKIVDLFRRFGPQ